MATDESFVLRIPSSLMNDIKRWAEKDATSINEFIVLALNERIAALKSRSNPEELTKMHFDERARRANLADFDRIVAKAGGDVRIPGDEFPEDYLENSKNSAGPQIK
jgi:hypothetical protein